MLFKLNQIILVNLLNKLDEYSDVPFEKIKKVNMLGYSRVKIELNKDLLFELTLNEAEILNTFLKYFIAEIELWDDSEESLLAQYENDVFYFCKRFFDWYEDPKNRLKLLYVINKQKIQF